MTTETVNILALILGAMSLLMAAFAIFVQTYISKMTNKLIEKEDERAKRMIEEGNKRHEELMKETQKIIDEGKKETQRMIEEGNKRHEELLKETQRMIEEGNKRLEEFLTRIHQDSMETQKIIDEGNKRLEKILLKIDESTKGVLAEILKKV